MNYAGSSAFGCLKEGGSGNSSQSEIGDLLGKLLTEIFEALIQERLRSFAEEHGLMFHREFGFSRSPSIFRARHGTQGLTHVWVDAQDSKVIHGSTFRRQENL